MSAVAVLDHPVVLPKMMFLSAWSMVDAGALPPAFGTNLHYWTGDDAKRTLEERTLASLSELGLARNGRLNVLWRNTLTVLANADSEYYAFSGFADGYSCSILIATQAGDALRTIIDDDVVALEPVDDKWHATALWDTLPEVPGAALRPVTVPKAFYEDPEHDRGGPLAEPVDTTDRDHLCDVMARERVAVHQIYAARRAGGRRFRSTPITAIDLADGQGRVLTYASADGHIVMLPATGRNRVIAVNDTMNSLGG